MEKDITLKEKNLSSEVDFSEIHKEKLVLGESLLNQIYLEKPLEVEKLQREVAYLSEQISVTHTEREIKASNAVLEVSSLHADKVKLESVLQDEQNKVKLLETEIHNIQLESGNKLQRLITEILASKKIKNCLPNGHANAPKRSISEGVERSVSSHEAELKYLQERYFHMSLRFVEIEAQRK
ncbi:hypothetical protein GIB67_014806 [Kingdonia uniflora]|uniref:Uncharacterized protein n=1 Tax=Kingdonia uniflora TaxID=39325 RepID=A0A7J7NUZ9_9MAGN|nr:hypothetical protein GIB67_014806 [Kingdonia uniflora]